MFRAQNQRPTSLKTKHKEETRNGTKRDEKMNRSKNDDHLRASKNPYHFKHRKKGKRNKEEKKTHSLLSPYHLSHIRDLARYLADDAFCAEKGYDR